MSPIIVRYKIPFLFSLVVGLALVVLRGETFWLNALLAFVGAILGMLLLDLEYVFFAYIVDVSHEGSKGVKAYLKRRNIVGLVDFLNQHEYKFGEMSIRSLLFVVILVIFSFYTVVSGAWIFSEAVVMSLLARLIYEQFVELQKLKTLKRWFWCYDAHLSERQYYLYLLILTLVYISEFSFV